jgi:ATP-dependent Zn protease
MLDPTNVNEYYDNDRRLKSFDMNMYEMVADFYGCTYSGIPDDDIVQIDLIQEVKNGKIVAVSYMYGISPIVRNYYVDVNGNTVKLKKNNFLKTNGYPSVDSFTRDINSHGFVVYDWFSIIMVIIFVIGLFLWWFVG